MNTVFLNLPFQSCFEIETDNKKLIEGLSMKYGTYVSHTPIEKTDFPIKVETFGNEYQISTRDGVHMTRYPLHEIDRFVFNNTTYSPSIFALHGAAVEWQGHCNLFLAPTTSGKTTLSSYLTTIGFGYVTEDCILLDRTDLCVYPCTTPIQLREGGMNVLLKHNAAPQAYTILDIPPVPKRFVYTPSNCIDYPTPLKNIFFIQLSDCENKLIEMPSIERMTELMKSPITNYPVTGDYLRFIAQLSKVNCYKIVYKDMDFVKEVIQGG